MRWWAALTLLTRCLNFTQTSRDKTNQRGGDEIRGKQGKEFKERRGGGVTSCWDGIRRVGLCLCPWVLWAGTSQHATVNTQLGPDLRFVQTFVSRDDKTLVLVFTSNSMSFIINLLETRVFKISWDFKENNTGSQRALKVSYKTWKPRRDPGATSKSPRGKPQETPQPTTWQKIFHSFLNLGCHGYHSKHTTGFIRFKH